MLCIIDFFLQGRYQPFPGHDTQAAAFFHALLKKRTYKKYLYLWEIKIEKNGIDKHYKPTIVKTRPGIYSYYAR